MYCPFCGKQADAALGAAYITVNKNAVPNDPQSPFVTSGIRVGTPAITTRGFGEAETAELTGKGVKFTHQPEEMPWGISAVFVDPYGHEHNLLQPFPME